MGFDLYGVKPKNKKGEYFRNTVWSWRPLWNYVTSAAGDALTAKEKISGYYNDGKEISEKKAKDIANKLKANLESGEVAQTVKAFKEEMEKAEDETCDICDGKGIRNDFFINGACNACGGKGKRRPFATNYFLEEENVKEFAEFCANSGGFTIC